MNDNDYALMFRAIADTLYFLDRRDDEADDDSLRQSELIAHYLQSMSVATRDKFCCFCRKYCDELKTNAPIQSRMVAAIPEDLGLTD